MTKKYRLFQLPCGHLTLCPKNFEQGKFGNHTKEGVIEVLQKRCQDCLREKFEKKRPKQSKRMLKFMVKLKHEYSKLSNRKPNEDRNNNGCPTSDA